MPRALKRVNFDVKRLKETIQETPTQDTPETGSNGKRHINTIEETPNEELEETKLLPKTNSKPKRKFQVETIQESPLEEVSETIVKAKRRVSFASSSTSLNGTSNGHARRSQSYDYYEYLPVAQEKAREAESGGVRRPKKVRPSRQMKVCVGVGGFVIVCVIIVVSVLASYHRNNDQELAVPTTSDQLFDPPTRRFNLTAGNGAVLLGILGAHMQDAVPAKFSNSSTSQNFTWPSHHRSLWLSSTYHVSTNSTCHHVAWHVPTSHATHIDCFNLTAGDWFAMFDTCRLGWPIRTSENASVETPLVTHGDSRQGAFSCGSFLDSYLLSSRGFSINSAIDSPVYISLNTSRELNFCLETKTQDSTFLLDGKDHFWFNYTICSSSDILAAYNTVQEHLNRTRGLSSLNFSIYEQPQWKLSQLEIDENVTLLYGQNVYNFTSAPSILALDTQWEDKAGDYSFNPTNFPDVPKMIAALEAQGISLTLPVHPFISASATSLKTCSDEGYCVTPVKSSLPALTLWGNQLTAVVDVTASEAAHWIKSRLLNVSSSYQNVRFSFIGGESSWLPSDIRLASPRVNPSVFSEDWSRLATALGGEMSFGYSGVGGASALVTLPARAPDWSSSDGLQSVIPLVLQTGLAGFPFVSPGPVCGETRHRGCSEQLYKRWLQLSVFLPSFQFGLPPWEFEEDFQDTIKALLTFREKVLVPEFLRDEVEASKRTGDPVIRPLWWKDPTSDCPGLITSNDEFLIGDKLLVAPILSPATRRDVIFPRGWWCDRVHGHTVFITASNCTLPYQVGKNEVLFFEALSGPGACTLTSV